MLSTHGGASFEDDFAFSGCFLVLISCIMSFDVIEFLVGRLLSPSMSPTGHRSHRPPALISTLSMQIGRRVTAGPGYNLLAVSLVEVMLVCLKHFIILNNE